MALTSRLSFALASTLTGTHDFAPPGSVLSLAGQIDLSSGTAAGQADKVFADQRTLAASATEDLDLAGSLADAFGATITFVKVKALLVRAAVGNTNNVVVGAAASNPWATLLNSTGTVALRPGAGFLAWAGAADATGYAVTASTGDLLKIANSAAGTSVTYDVAVIGTSA